MFPLLRGPKIAPMWLRILVIPGGATLSNIAAVEVAVDVQVRKVTEYLGLTATKGLPIEKAKRTIQNAWREQVRRFGAVGDA